MEPGSAIGLILSDDLIDGSRVTTTARALGREVRQARSQDELVAAIREQRPVSVFLDLHNASLDLAHLIATVHTLAARPRIIGFGSHVDAARLRAARQAGCDLVLPRSQFFEDLESSLNEWLRPIA